MHYFWSVIKKYILLSLPTPTVAPGQM